MADVKADAEALVPKFQLERILNQGPPFYPRSLQCNSTRFVWSNT